MLQMLSVRLSNYLAVRKTFWLQLVVVIVGSHGVFVLAETLLDQLAGHPGLHLSSFSIDIPLLIGLGLVYLSGLLARRKRTAWVAALVFYTFMLGFYAANLQTLAQHHEYLGLTSKFGLPLVIIGLLSLFHRNFTVKSDIQSFRYSLRTSIIVLAVALVYGTVGYALMDQHDFHQEITINEALHRTVDQFGLTTDPHVMPHTRRAHAFVDSLSVVSIAAVSYAVISLFQPIRWRYTHRRDDYGLANDLIRTHAATSEEFFKLWPLDKHYIFNDEHTGGVVYHVSRGIALAIGDPIGTKRAASAALRQFEDMCYGNDWSPVFVHTEPRWSGFYEQSGYKLQKIGEEAIIDVSNFQNSTAKIKYFRQVQNKFTRAGYTIDIVQPPHNKAIIERLRIISDDWLKLPGREERGLVMGYFSEDYLQQCTLVLARDAAATIQGFLNQLPMLGPEATYDMLRHSQGSLGNCNDFLLLGLIKYLQGQGVERLNLGLCPLKGLDDLEEKSVISRALEFVYSNGDRFYSFSGLTKFKAKYEPEWSERYVAYKGGVSNFVKAMSALTRAMRVK